MDTLNPQAVDLNRIMSERNAAAYSLLSARGRAIYYPAKGILAQGAAARGKEINATIGTAYEDDGKPMVMPGLARLIGIDSRDAFPYAPSAAPIARATFSVLPKTESYTIKVFIEPPLLFLPS